MKDTNINQHLSTLASLIYYQQPSAYHNYHFNMKLSALFTACLMALHVSCEVPQPAVEQAAQPAFHPASHPHHHDHHQKVAVRNSKSPLFYKDGVLNLQNLEQRLDNCEVVQELNVKLEEEHAHHHDSLIERIFEKLFPFGPAWNSVLATLYISGPPNFILAFIPASIDPSKLSMLVSFAVGGLLGDVFLHLLPQTFLGEPVDEKAHFVFIDEQRNVVLGIFIFVGFAFFFSIDKLLRILNHEEGTENGGHSHSHSHSHSHNVTTEGTTSALQEKDSTTLKNRKSNSKSSIDESDADTKEIAAQNISASVRTAAWLNLISDFTHNITDGLAITAAFYISKSVGSTTALAVFLHEVPHEIGDFAVLIQGGFSKWQAMNSQFVTAAGAFLGCFIGIGVQSLVTSPEELAKGIASGASANSGGLFGTTVTIGDLTLPFTAGGFLYIATVGVIPEVLELGESTTRLQELRKAVVQMFFILLGIGLMFGISYFE